MIKLFKQDRKNVALALSSGGARGLAHIGAIDALEARGYRITSIAGTSMGALVAGMYASGHLEDFKQWMRSVDRKRVRDLTDFSFRLSYMVKGERIIEALKQFAPDVNIEDLPIPYCAVATDWTTGREVLFTRGSLYRAIRASISVPAVFEPVRFNDHILIDGGITDPIPVDKVHRGKDDLLVAVNVSGHDYDGIHEREKLAEELQKKKSRALSLIFKILPEDTHPTFNYYTLIDRSISIAITHNAHRALRLCPPDILVDLPMKRYGGNDYDKYPQLHRIGAQKMNRAIDSFLAGKSISIRLPF